MAFQLDGQINLTGPSTQELNRIVAQIQSHLNSIKPKDLLGLGDLQAQVRRMADTISGVKRQAKDLKRAVSEASTTPTVKKSIGLGDRVKKGPDISGQPQATLREQIKIEKAKEVLTQNALEAQRKANAEDKKLREQAIKTQKEYTERMKNLITRRNKDVQRYLDTFGVEPKTKTSFLRDNKKNPIARLIDLTEAERRKLNTKGKLKGFFSEEAYSLGANVKSFGRFVGAATAVYGVVSAIREGISSVITFDSELVKLSQISETTVKEVKPIGDEVERLAKTLGVSSTSLIKTAGVLKQAGFSLKETKGILGVIAKTNLAATFGSEEETTSGAIALLNQFKLRDSNNVVGELDRTLSAINKVAKKYAVESADLIEAIEKSGGAFAAAGGSYEEFLGFITTVRQVTRESPSTIATGIRTIVSRLQSVSRGAQLKELAGINLRDTEGQFVGPYKAILAIAERLKNVKTTDPLYNQVVNIAAGLRQERNLIPLLQNPQLLQSVIKDAEGGGQSLTEDAIKAQQALATQFQKTKEEFLALVRAFAGSDEIKALASGFLELTRNVVKFAETMGPALSILGAIGAYKALKFAPSVAGGLFGITNNRNQGIMRFIGKKDGGYIPGSSQVDDQPAMLQRGEFVISQKGVRSAGVPFLNEVNKGNIQGFADGGSVGKFKYATGITYHAGTYKGGPVNPLTHFGTKNAALQRILSIMPSDESDFYLSSGHVLSNKFLHLGKDSRQHRPHNIISSIYNQYPTFHKLLESLFKKHAETQGNLSRNLKTLAGSDTYDYNKVLSDFIEETGYDLFGYNNEVEDPGSLSYITTKSNQFIHDDSPKLIDRIELLKQEKEIKKPFDISKNLVKSKKLKGFASGGIKSAYDLIAPMLAKPRSVGIFNKLTTRYSPKRNASRYLGSGSFGDVIGINDDYVAKIYHDYVENSLLVGNQKAKFSPVQIEDIFEGRNFGQSLLDIRDDYGNLAASILRRQKGINTDNPRFASALANISEKGFAEFVKDLDFLESKNYKTDALHLGNLLVDKDRINIVDIAHESQAMPFMLRGSNVDNYGKLFNELQEQAIFEGVAKDYAVGNISPMHVSDIRRKFLSVIGGFARGGRKVRNPISRSWEDLINAVYGPEETSKKTFANPIEELYARAGVPLFFEDVTHPYADSTKVGLPRNKYSLSNVFHELGHGLRLDTRAYIQGESYKYRKYIESYFLKTYKEGHPASREYLKYKRSLYKQYGLNPDKIDSQAKRFKDAKILKEALSEQDVSGISSQQFAEEGIKAQGKLNPLSARKVIDSLLTTKLQELAFTNDAIGMFGSKSNIPDILLEGPAEYLGSRKDLQKLGASEVAGLLPPPNYSQLAKDAGLASTYLRLRGRGVEQSRSMRVAMDDIVAYHTKFGLDSENKEKRYIASRDTRFRREIARRLFLFSPKKFRSLIKTLKDPEMRAIYDRALINSEGLPDVENFTKTANALTKKHYRYKESFSELTKRLRAEKIAEQSQKEKTFKSTDYTETDAKLDAKLKKEDMSDFNQGGIKVNSRLEPGEIVIDPRTAKGIGYDVLDAVNFSGKVPGSGKGDKVMAHLQEGSYVLSNKTLKTLKGFVDGGKKRKIYDDYISQGYNPSIAQILTDQAIKALEFRNKKSTRTQAQAVTQDFANLPNVNILDVLTENLEASFNRQVAEALSTPAASKQQAIKFADIKDILRESIKLDKGGVLEGVEYVTPGLAKFGKDFDKLAKTLNSIGISVGTVDSESAIFKQAALSSSSNISGLGRDPGIVVNKRSYTSSEGKINLQALATDMGHELVHVFRADLITGKDSIVSRYSKDFEATIGSVLENFDAVYEKREGLTPEAKSALRQKEVLAEAGKAGLRRQLGDLSAEKLQKLIDVVKSQSKDGKTANNLLRRVLREAARSEISFAGTGKSKLSKQVSDIFQQANAKQSDITGFDFGAEVQKVYKQLYREEYAKSREQYLEKRTARTGEAASNVRISNAVRQRLAQETQQRLEEQGYIAPIPITGTTSYTKDFDIGQEAQQKRVDKQFDAMRKSRSELQKLSSKDLEKQKRMLKDQRAQRMSLGAGALSGALFTFGMFDQKAYESPLFTGATAGAGTLASLSLLNITGPGAIAGAGLAALKVAGDTLQQNTINKSEEKVALADREIQRIGETLSRGTVVDPKIIKQNIENSKQSTRSSEALKLSSDSMFDGMSKLIGITGDTEATVAKSGNLYKTFLVDNLKKRGAFLAGEDPVSVFEGEFADNPNIVNQNLKRQYELAKISQTNFIRKSLGSENDLYRQYENQILQNIQNKLKKPEIGGGISTSAQATAFFEKELASGDLKYAPILDFIDSLDEEAQKKVKQRAAILIREKANREEVFNPQEEQLKALQELGYDISDATNKYIQELVNSISPDIIKNATQQFIRMTESLQRMGESATYANDIISSNAEQIFTSIQNIESPSLNLNNNKEAIQLKNISALNLSEVQQLRQSFVGAGFRNSGQAFDQIEFIKNLEAQIYSGQDLQGAQIKTADQIKQIADTLAGTSESSAALSELIDAQLQEEYGTDTEKLQKDIQAGLIDFSKYLERAVGPLQQILGLRQTQNQIVNQLSAQAVSSLNKIAGLETKGRLGESDRALSLKRATGRNISLSEELNAIRQSYGVVPGAGGAGQVSLKDLTISDIQARIAAERKNLDNITKQPQSDATFEATNKSIALINQYNQALEQLATDTSSYNAILNRIAEEEGRKEQGRQLFRGLATSDVSQRLQFIRDIALANDVIAGNFENIQNVNDRRAAFRGIDAISQLNPVQAEQASRDLLTRIFGAELNNQIGFERDGRAGTITLNDLFNQIGNPDLENQANLQAEQQRAANNALIAQTQEQFKLSTEGFSQSVIDFNIAIQAVESSFNNLNTSMPPFINALNNFGTSFTPPQFNKGGLVPGIGNKDSVLAMLTPGEYVLTKEQVKNMQYFANGGIVKKELDLLKEGVPLSAILQAPENQRVLENSYLTAPRYAESGQFISSKGVLALEKYRQEQRDQAAKNAGEMPLSLLSQNRFNQTDPSFNRDTGILKDPLTLGLNDKKFQPLYRDQSIGASIFSKPKFEIKKNTPFEHPNRKLVELMKKGSTYSADTSSVDDILLGTTMGREVARRNANLTDMLRGGPQERLQPTLDAIAEVNERVANKQKGFELARTGLGISNIALGGILGSGQNITRGSDSAFNRSAFGLQSSGKVKDQAAYDAKLAARDERLAAERALKQQNRAASDSTKASAFGIPKTKLTTEEYAKRLMDRNPGLTVDKAMERAKKALYKTYEFSGSRASSSVPEIRGTNNTRNTRGNDRINNLEQAAREQRKADSQTPESFVSQQMMAEFTQNVNNFSNSINLFNTAVQNLDGIKIGVEGNMNMNLSFANGDALGQTIGNAVVSHIAEYVNTRISQEISKVINST